MSSPRYVLIDAKNLSELVEKVHNFLDTIPLFYPVGSPIHDIDGTPGGTWYQAVYWKSQD